MATISGYTKSFIDAVFNSTIISGTVNASGNLILSKRGGGTVDAGSVKGAKGDPGTAGNALSAWPVGSIFMATVSTSPATLLGGGTWARWGKGRMPVSLDESQTEFDAVEETGGEKTVTLTAAQMPKHNHSYNADFSVTATPADGAGSGENGGLSVAQGSTGGRFAHPITLTGSMTTAGNDAAHNNLPPYITCYMWKRTA